MPLLDSLENEAEESLNKQAAEKAQNEQKTAAVSGDSTTASDPAKADSGEGATGGTTADPAQAPASDDSGGLLTEDVVATDASIQITAETFDEDQIPGLVDDIFTQALKKKASDVHFKPLEDKLVVYFRVDGQMIPYKEYEKVYHHPIVARIKIISGLKIDEHRLPQDGKSSFAMGEQEVDLRVSVLPSNYGEKIVIRLLDKNPHLVQLRDLGMLPNSLLKVEEALKSSYGMILAVGPTGSGKSTSLFSMISTFDATQYNISTLEDPIEYKIPHVTQTQINTEIDFDFSDGLRSLVRQDPDIIMVGEIRDQKTASLAIESALTGHLVFSTLHTNSAVGTIQRLLNMDIDRFLIAAAVKVIISQRLARKVCSNCREQYPIPEKYYELYRRETDIDPTQGFFYKGKGCNVCNDTGYSGRVGMFELMEISPAIEELIMANASAAEIEAQAIKEGMVLIRKDALYKAATGDISIEEALRIMS